MSSIITPSFASTLPPEPIKRLRVEQYHAMIQAGIFDGDDSVELLEGWLVEKMPKKPAHSVTTGLLSDAITSLLLSDWHLITQEPITTSDSEPEPDLAIIRGKRRDYLDRHPQPEEVGLIVEVADTTLARDRGVKKSIYARAGIPVYWIVNLVENCVEVYSDPTGPADTPDYRHAERFGPLDKIPLLLDGNKVGHCQVKDFLP